MRHLVTAMLFAGLALPANAEIIRKSSPHSVSETADRLAAEVEGAGATVVARIDHAAAAAGVDAELRPTTVLVFGNPKLGTPVMQADQAAGLDLPMRVVIFEGADGAVTVAYHDPAELAASHAVPAELEALGMMAGALDKLTGTAVAP